MRNERKNSEFVNKFFFLKKREVKVENEYNR